MCRDEREIPMSYERRCKREFEDAAWIMGKNGNETVSIPQGQTEREDGEY